MKSPFSYNTPPSCCLSGKIRSTAIDAMERNNIFQWDDLYPAKEDFQEDVNKNQLYVGSVNGQDY